MRPGQKAELQIHLCVVLWGFTAILGKLISLQALQLVWWRMLVVSAVLACVPRVRQGLLRMPGRLVLAYAGIGCVVALHWLTFYAAVKLANASAGATCMAIAPVFLAFVEPLVTGRPFRPRELWLGLAVVPGVALVVGGVPGGMRVGLLVGALSALLVALFGALNKRLVEHGSPLTVSFVELGAGAGLLTLLAPLLPHVGPAFVLPGPRDAVLLGTLALACTLLPFSLSLWALRHLSAFGAQLAINLEPVYAVLFSVALLGEQHQLKPGFYLGVAIILVATLGHPLLVREEPAAAPPEALGAVDATGP